MGRRHWHPSACRNFDESGDHSGRISATGLCPSCGKAAMDTNVDQMVARSGPNFTKWRHGMIRCAGGLVLDDRQPTA